ncbi:MAG: hypothetical protein KDK30_11425 [Leptospiraceae bacterium]|nr:hypothetical protein [Leptospiraceae bacterium]MCB1316525.1 hypothetical protein [Leptospiraceae bacterium]MCB1320260.1 hypothetical protein [Leptospiraceae bacterium]
METRIGAEIGLSKVNRGEIVKIQTQKNDANLPGSPTTNRQAEQIAQDASALRPMDNKSRFQLLGNTVNIQA